MANGQMIFVRYLTGMVQNRGLATLTSSRSGSVLLIPYWHCWAAAMRSGPATHTTLSPPSYRRKKILLPFLSAGRKRYMAEVQSGKVGGFD
jgi:hypothetical protein